MLCPKCNYISFDHLSNCTNCNNDLSALVSEISGTAVQVGHPSFLRSVLKADSAEAGGGVEPPAMAEGEPALNGTAEFAVRATEMIELSPEIDDEPELQLEEEGGLDISELGAEAPTMEMSLAEESAPAEEIGAIDLQLEEEISVDLGSLEESGESSAADGEGISGPLEAGTADDEPAAGIDFSPAAQKLAEKPGAEAAEGDAGEGIEFDLSALTVASPEEEDDDQPAGDQAAAGQPDSAGLELYLDLTGTGSAAEADGEQERAEQPRPLSLDLSALTMEKDDSSAPAAGGAVAAPAAEDQAKAGADRRSEMMVDLENIDLSDLVQASGHAADGAEEQGADSQSRVINLDDPASIEELSLELDSDEQGDDSELNPVDLTGGDDNDIFDLSTGGAAQEKGDFSLEEDDDDEIVIDLSLERDDQ